MAARPDDDHTQLQTDLHVEATYRLTEALVEAENRMRRRVERLSEVVFETDRDGRLVFVNPAWAAVAGSPASSALGSRLQDYICADDHAELERVIGCAAETATAPTAEFRLCRADGSLAWVELSAVSQDGVVIGTLRDITRRRIDQDELAKLSLVASSTDNLVIITDAEGRTEWVNDAFVKRTGYTLAEMAGRKPGHILQGPQSDGDAVARVRRNLAAGRSFQDELLNVTKDGEPYWVTFHITPIRDARGRIERFISVQTDTTGLRRTQHELEAAKERAEAASQAKSLFLATMSHEMRTPLNVILGSTDLMLDDDACAPSLRAHVARIGDNAEILLRLITDVLDVSKIEAGQVNIERIPFALRACIQQAVAPIEGRAREKRLRFGLRCDPALPAQVMGDPDRLRQIVANLAENAVKFTDEGFVLVEARSADARSGETGRIEIRVADSGVGISPEAQQRIFDRFEQGDSSTTRRKGGAGLGLHIVQLLTTAMGGQIRLRSVVGAGSEFIVELPLETVRDSAPARFGDRPALMPAAAGSGAGGTGARILVAEDTDANFAVIEACLTKAGYRVTRARDGHQAVTAAGEGFDLVLMDVEMPGMDGLEATAAMRRDEARRGVPPVPVIAVTAHAVQGYRERCLAAGCTSYLSKPVRRTTLLDAVRQFVPEPHRPVVTVDAELAHLVPEFFEYCRAERVRLIEALDRQDWSLAARLAHGLKGAGPSLGFDEVGAFGRDIEAAARAGNAALARRTLDELAGHLSLVQVVTA